MTPRAATAIFAVSLAAFLVLCFGFVGVIVTGWGG